MKQILFRLFFIFITAVLLTACAGNQVKNDGVKTPDKIHKVITATGQSVLTQAAGLSEQQIKLKAEQKAKMRAYRSLAAALYHEKLNGAKTVASLVMRDESYRVYVDLFLREAKSGDSQILGKTLLTQLNLSLTDRFYRCMNATVEGIRRCLLEDNKMQFTRLGYNSAEVKTVNLACGAADCSDLFHVGGFNRQKNGFDRGLLSAGLYDSEWIVNASGRLLANFLLIQGITQ